MKTPKTTVLIAFALLVTACGSPEERASRHLADAHRMFEAGDIVTAKIEAQNAAQIEPRNAEARLLLADIAEIDEDYRTVVGHLLIATESDPTNVDTLVRLGTYYYLAKAEDRAVKYAAKATDLDPEGAEVLLLNARVSYLQGDRDTALTRLDAALATDAGLVDAIIFKAAMVAELEKWDEAFALVEKGLDVLPKERSETLRQFRIQLLRNTGRVNEIEAEILSLADDFPEEERYQYELVRHYIQQDKTDEAEQMLRDLADKDPEDTARQLDLARYLVAQRGFETAEEYLTGLINAQPESQSVRMALGALYENNDRREQALDVYRDVVEISPRSEDALRARNRMVVNHLRDDELDSARKETQSILADAPNDPEALLYRAAFAFVDEDYDSAIADLRVLLRNEENSEPGLLLLARSYVRDGDAVLAQDTYQKLLAIYPNNGNAPDELAVLLANQGNIVAAEKVLRTRLEVDPADSRAASRLIQALLAQQELDVAETEARKLVEITEDNALAQFQLGRVMEAKDSPEEAIAAYKATLEENPQATLALQGLVKVLLNNDRASEALAFVIQHRNENADVDLVPSFFLEGAAQAKLGDLDAARAAYENVIERQPATPQAYAALAGLQIQGSKEQIAVLKRGWDAIPNDPNFGLLLATAYESDESWDDAITILEEVVAANPDNLIAINNLAALLLDRRNDEAGRARAQQLVTRLRDSDQPAFLDTVGWAYYRNGDFPNAVRYLERAVAGAGQVPVLRYHLGMAYAANQNALGAKQELNQAIQDSDVDFFGIEEAKKKLAELNAS